METVMLIRCTATVVEAHRDPIGGTSQGGLGKCVPRLARALPVAKWREPDGLAKQAGGVAAAVPADLTHGLLYRQVGLAQQPGQMLSP